MTTQAVETIPSPSRQERVLASIDQNIPAASSPKEQIPKAKSQTPEANWRTSDIIGVSRDCVNFGDCHPGSIHEADLTFYLMHPIDPVLINIRSFCLDDNLNDLSEYVFGIRRSNSNEYSDQSRLKVSEGAGTRLLVGVKTPCTPSKMIEGVLIIELPGLKIEPMIIKLEQRVRIPTIECTKELVSESSNSIIKIMMKKKGKKDIKVPLKNPQPYKLVSDCEVVGNDRHCLVECTSKTVVFPARGQVYVTIAVKMTEELRREIEACKEVYKIRRVLVLKVKESSVFVHYPVEISFYEAQKGQGSQ